MPESDHASSGSGRRRRRPGFLSTGGCTWRSRRSTSCSPSSGCSRCCSPSTWPSSAGTDWATRVRRAGQVPLPGQGPHVLAVALEHPGDLGDVDGADADPGARPRGDAALGGPVQERSTGSPTSSRTSPRWWRWRSSSAASSAPTSAWSTSCCESLGLPTVGLVRHPWGIKIAIATLMTWQWVGYNTIIYLAGLQAIPTELYEAAKVDGAGPVRTFFSITLPLLRPVDPVHRGHLDHRRPADLHRAAGDVGSNVANAPTAAARARAG